MSHTISYVLSQHDIIQVQCLPALFAGRTAIWVLVAPSSPGPVAHLSFNLRSKGGCSRVYLPLHPLTLSRRLNRLRKSALPAVCQPGLAGAARLDTDDDGGGGGRRGRGGPGLSLTIPVTSDEKHRLQEGGRLPPRRGGGWGKGQGLQKGSAGWGPGGA